MKRALGLLAAAAVLAGLSACGLKGDLKTPGPMWGDPERTAVDRTLPNASDASSDRIVFTRDDVDVFARPREEEDPFANDDEGEPAPSGTTSSTPTTAPSGGSE
jgi:predicted small lipoprotein YifL